MAKGESTWSSKGVKTVKFNSTPLAPGEYDLRIDPTWAQACATGEGKVPYLKGSFTALNTATSEGGKDRKVFHNIFIELTPDKNGVPMATRGNNILGLARALGLELEDAPTVTLSGKELLAPAYCKQFVLNNEGSVVKAKIKIEKGTNGFEDQNRIVFFVEAEPQEESSFDESPSSDTVEEEAEFTPPTKIAGVRRK